MSGDARAQFDAEVERFANQMANAYGSPQTVTDYPPGSLGAEWERLTAELDELARDRHPLVRWYARRLLRQAERARVRRDARRDATLREYFTGERRP